MNHETVGMAMVLRVLGVYKSLNGGARAVPQREKGWSPECAMLGKKILEVAVALKNEVKTIHPLPQAQQHLLKET